MVRPHLEYAAPVWNPAHKKNIRKIESVQRRATKQVPELNNLVYHERLTKLHLPTLAYRHLRGDMLEIFKMITEKYDPKVLDLLSLHSHEAGRYTRGHTFKLKKPSCSNNISKHFFTRRVVNIWNNLPKSVVEAPTLNTFKNRLNKSWENLDIMYNFDAAMAKENPFTATGGFETKFHQCRK